MNPVGLAFGPDRSMYIAELGGHRIRMIDPAGIIWTLAGQSDETGAGIRAMMVTAVRRVLPP